MVSLKKPALVLLSVFVVFALAASSYGDPRLGVYKGGRPAGPKFVPGEVIVKFKAGVGEVPIGAVHRRHGTGEFYRSALAGFRRARVPQGKTVAQVVAALRQEASVEYAEPNYIVTAHMVPDDPLYGYQWHMDNSDYGGIQMEAAWDIQTGNVDVVVAVIDTGVAYENYRKGRNKYYVAPDLANTTFVEGYDYVENDAHPNDDNSHGTHVAGTIAQSTNNGVGVAGVASNTSIMPVKVLDKDGYGNNGDVADGIYWATDNGADVINLSLGGPDPSSTLEDAVAYAYNNGVTVIASSGNDGEDGANTVGYPAAYDDYVIAVGATQYDESRAPYSSYGSSLDLVAPGGNVYVDQNGDGYGDGVLQNTFNPDSKNRQDFNYWFFHGTSMAAPHVSGVAALLIAEGVATTPDQVRLVLESTAEDKGESGWDEQYGCGIVDAYAALQWTAEPPVPTVWPLAETECPVVSTNCPLITTECPVVSTTCPEIVTGCPVVSTTCPEIVVTECPVVSTTCPEIATGCPVVSTTCPEIVTECPTPPAGPTAHVTIDMSKKVRKTVWQVTAKVLIRDTDADGPPIEGATVSGHWSGDHIDSVSGSTDRKGKVAFKTPLLQLQGTDAVTFTVITIAKNGTEYIPSDESETSDSITNETAARHP